MSQNPRPLIFFNQRREQSLPYLVDPEIDKCFARAKTAITEATILAHPNHEADLELIADASDRAIGASCIAADLLWKMPTACILFKALTPAQKAWSCFKRKLFACYVSIKHFQYFLEGRDFTLKTNHKPIVKKFQHNFSAASPQQARYIDYILQFTSNIEHVSGNDNIADAFS